jgi:hypothetical protein
MTPKDAFGSTKSDSVGWRPLVPKGSFGSYSNSRAAVRAGVFTDEGLGTTSGAGRCLWVRLPSSPPARHRPRSTQPR